MKVNVGRLDRVLRILIGLALIGWAAFFQGPVWAWIGVLPLLTGLASRCPAYALLGVRTCGSKAQ